MTPIFNDSDENAPFTKPSAKSLVCTERYFAKEQPVFGKRPRGFTSKSFMAAFHPGEEFPFELGVSGIDMYRPTPLIGLAFDSELLRDGYTDEQRVQALASELKREVQRMQAAPPVQQSTANALAVLQPDLCALHNLGYTIEELHRLVVGTLRVSITPDELLAAMFS